MSTMVVRCGKFRPDITGLVVGFRAAAIRNELIWAVTGGPVKGDVMKRTPRCAIFCESAASVSHIRKEGCVCCALRLPLLPLPEAAV